MVYDTPSHYACPHCGALKAIVTLISGNTFGGTFWSDCRAFYPMLPKPSPVQRCTKCGHFFFLRDAKKRQGRGYGGGGTKGELSWEDSKAALRQFSAEWQQTGAQPLPRGAKPLLRKLSTKDRAEREYTMRLLAVHAYNDAFCRRRKRRFFGSEDGPEPDAQDRELFRHNAERLLELMKDEPSQILLRVEILRELGRFDEARALLDTFSPTPDNPENVAKMLRKQIRKKNTAPFIIHGDSDD